MNTLWLHWFALLTICLIRQNPWAFSRSLTLNQRWESHQQCIEMGGSDFFSPTTESSLILTFQQGHSGVVSIVMFELGDEHLGGMRVPGTSEKAVLCDQENVDRGLCRASQVGEFLISDSARRRARHEFITRAVNLSEPVPVIYHVPSPGYYCTAAMLSSGRSFSATMLAIEPGAPVAAFRAGLLAVYRLLAPSWVLLAVVWMISLTLPRRRGMVCWLVPLSALQVLTRWAALEAGSQGLNVAWGFLWYLLASGQYLVVVLHTWASVAMGQASNHHRTCSEIGIALALLVFQCAASWADFTTRADSRGPSYINILYGPFLGLFLTVSAMRLLRRPSDESKTARQALPRKAELGLCAALVIIALLFVFVAMANLWVILKTLTPEKFATRFWQVRSWLFDAPRDYIFLLWTVCLVVYGWYGEAYELRLRQQNATSAEEMQCLRDSVEDTDV